MAGDGLAVTPGEQRDLVFGAFERLRPLGQYTFLVLALERLLAMCRDVFPSGLPTKVVPYEKVDAAISELWLRRDRMAAVPDIAHEAEAWRPLSSGYVEHRPGAALGYHVSQSIAVLATVQLGRPLIDALELIWEAIFTSLYRQPENADYSRPISRTQLDGDLNRSLLREFQLQVEILEVVGGPDLVDVDVLRAESRRVASTIAQWEHDYLRRS